MQLKPCVAGLTSCAVALMTFCSAVLQIQVLSCIMMSRTLLLLTYVAVTVCLCGLQRQCFTTLIAALSHLDAPCSAGCSASTPAGSSAPAPVPSLQEQL